MPIANVLKRKKAKKIVSKQVKAPQCCYTREARSIKQAVLARGSHTWGF